MKTNKEIDEFISGLHARGVDFEIRHAIPMPLDIDVPEISEKKFMAAVIAFAKKNNWKIYHTYDSRKSNEGFPDCVFVRDRIVFTELKSAKGKLSAAQKTWVEVLRHAGSEVYIWRPSDWHEIERVLK